ncbi:hypothetical protein 2 [Beihai razor shell virus 1]|uniref:hypothetical protein 2 n=1 Tax=Beihai razor shell virus 1 TaxID=1922645 RepID=UPI00090B6A02|nr:hypothetical protein 2 [Beihai razor shell virus 1]APG76695.1 hypothetical protein [Beihai razor shell virus 1]APG78901.1 hypothetical protein 2 [Beihai razor shell virus 1]
MAVCLSRHAVINLLLAATNSNKNTQSSALETEQNTTFVENNTIATIPEITVVDSTFNDGAVDNIALANWFSRPVVISSHIWNDGAHIDFEFFPWYEFFTNPSIKNKLYGYSRLRCNLHLKFLINGSPFQYSAVIASYKPLVDPNNALNDFSGGVINTISVTRNGQLVGYSQRMNVELYPQTSEGGVLALPFIHHKNWMDLSAVGDTFENELKKMGISNVTSIVPLHNSSGTPGSDVTITVYAWATDVQLSGPAYELQADEYTDKPVSSMASSVAAAAGMLSKVPIIGPYALATSIGATAVASIARIFGFSNVPTIADTMPYKNRTVGNLANVQVGEILEPLTLDPKNELSIDSRTVGYDGTDELLISNYAGRKSYFTVVDWLHTYTPGTQIFTCYVTPELYQIDTCNFVSSGSYKALSMVPACHAAQLFHRWRGPIKFTFKVLASRYCRGRLRIAYDPNGNLNHNPTTQINEVWDISAASEFELVVPYMGSTAFKQTGILTNTAYQVPLFGGFGYTMPTYSDGRFNGVITIEVVNELAAPDPTDGVNIACYVSAPDIEFAEPFNMEQRYFDATGLVTSAPVMSYLDPYEIQSDEGPLPDNTVTTDNTGVVQGEAAYSVYMGEVVKSLRTLMHRSVRHAYYYFEGPTTNQGTLDLFNIYTPRFPRTRGSTTAGMSRINNSATVGVKPYNICRTAPMAWLTAAFVGWRGSINWRAVMTESPHAFDSAALCISRVSKAMRYDQDPFIYMSRYDETAMSSAKASSLAMNHSEDDSNGVTVAITDVEPVVTARMPMYTDHRMFPANAIVLNDTTKISNTGVEYDNMKISSLAMRYHDASHRVVTLNTYVSAGHDFTPFVFVNVPTIYLYDASSTETPDPTFHYPVYLFT